MGERDQLSRLRVGDEAAFLQAVDAHGPWALAFARLHEADEARALDAVVQAWETVLSRMAEAPERSLHVQVVAQMHQVFAAGGRDGHAPGPEAPASGGSLCAALGRISHEDREMLLLRDVAGWRLGDVAAALALEPPVARARLEAARTALARACRP